MSPAATPAPSPTSIPSSPRGRPRPHHILNDNQVPEPASLALLAWSGDAAVPPRVPPPVSGNSVTRPLGSVFLASRSAASPRKIGCTLAAAPPAARRGNARHVRLYSGAQTPGPALPWLRASSYSRFVTIRGTVESTFTSSTPPCPRRSIPPHSPHPARYVPRGCHDRPGTRAHARAPISQSSPAPFGSTESNSAPLIPG